VKRSLDLEPGLADELIPFSISFASSGEILAVSPLLKRVWNLEGEQDLSSLQQRLLLRRPFYGRLKSEFIPELIGMIVHLELEGLPEHVLRGQIYPNLGGWLLTGFPRISSVSELDAYGILLSDLPLHTAVGELLIANEATQASLVQAREQEAQLRTSVNQVGDLNASFARFVPTAILENIGIDGPINARRGRYVETRKAVMFADLQGFSLLSEKLSAAACFAMINEFLSLTVPCIEANDGYVVQYLGDGMMALFPSGTSQAIDAAVAMQRSLREATLVNQETDSQLSMSIGIHEGPVSLGIIGNETRWDATIIADAVNTSSKIESMTRMLGGEILVSKQTLDACGDAHRFKTRSLGSHQIRGRKGQLELVEILDAMEVQLLNDRTTTLDTFAEGLKFYREGDLYSALSCFSRVLAQVPQDPAAQYYLGRISQRLAGLPQ